MLRTGCRIGSREMIAGLVCVLLAGSAGADEAQNRSQEPVWTASGLFAQRALDEDDESERRPPPETEVVEAPRRPSPALALLFSAAAPGTGQLYAGKRRGLIYMALEAAALFAHFSFKADSKDREDEYRGFADAQWDTLRYRDAAGEPGCEWSADADSIIAASRRGRSDLFYDLISRGDYACGWRESWQLEHYREVRDVTDDLEGKANTALTFLFLNHVISAVDAFRAARSMQMSVAPKTEVRMDVKGSIGDPMAVVRIIHHL
ncbi:MAG: hypothetical protein GF355_00390 [Candidatus Eisenbacteria bacterium]|nr:hypothetical protein [Candidatus Eisenbacteria bacterium]